MSLLKWREEDANCISFKTFWKADILNLHLDFLDLCEGRYWGGRQYYFREGFSIYPKLSKSDGPIPWTHQLLAPNGIHIFCRSVDEAKEIAETMYKRIVDAVREQMDIKEPEPVVQKPLITIEEKIKRLKELDDKLNGRCYIVKSRNDNRSLVEVQEPLITIEELDKLKVNDMIVSIQQKEPVAERLKKALKSSLNQTKEFNEIMYRRYCRNLKHKTEKLLSMLEKRGIEGRVFYSRIRGSYGWKFSQNGSEPIGIGSNYKTALKCIEQGSLDIYK